MFLEELTSSPRKGRATEQELPSEMPVVFSVPESLVGEVSQRKVRREIT